MNISPCGAVLLVFLISWFRIAPAAATPLTFVPREIYTTASFGRDINEYSPDGRLLRTLELTNFAPGEETKGIGFGPDGRLYVVADRLFESARLVAIDQVGTILSSYPLPSSTGGNLSYGKIAFGPGNVVYVGTGAGLVRVDTANPLSAQIIRPGDVFDLVLLPTGNLLLLEAYRLLEVNPNGIFVREIRLTDPNRVSEASFFFYNDLRGVEYDVARNRLFVSMLGNSDNLFFKTMAFDFATGVLQNIGTFIYGDDMYLRKDGSLLLGSRVERPWILSAADLSVIGQLDGTERMFITSLDAAPVGGPATLVLLVLGLAVSVALRRPRPTR